MAALGGNLHAGMQDLVKEYNSKFGIDKPLWKQYLIYLVDMSRFDFGYSIANYPRRVSEMILEGLPWTIALITTTTLISFVIGNILGAFQAWPRAPRWVMALMPPLLSMSAIPFFLLGLILVYVVGFRLQLAPMYGGYTAGSIPQWSFEVRPRRGLARGSAGDRDHPGLARRLGARHARDDGDDAGRGLRHFRARRRACRIGRFSSTTASATPCCRK